MLNSPGVALDCATLHCRMAHVEWFICTAQNIALKAGDERLAQSRCMLYYCTTRFIAAHANPDLELLNDLKVSWLQHCMMCFLAVHA